jgi:UMF1 family MFS transporter
LFGLDKETAEHVRIVGPLVAVWYAVFALPLFMFTPDRRATGRPLGAAVVQGVRTLRRTLMEVRRYRDTALYLVAHMLYADGLNTLFVFGAIYAAGTFGMDVAEVTLFGIVLNVTSGLGAFAFAWVDDWIGPKRTIILSLIGLVLCGTIALVAPDKAAFWVGASMIGIFLGPTQAASRSLMTRLSPPAMRTEMFGLYALSGKATAFVGPFLLSTVTLTFGNQRAGMATIIVFLLLGLGLLLAVREPPAEAAVLPAAA